MGSKFIKSRLRQSLSSEQGFRRDFIVGPLYSTSRKKGILYFSLIYDRSNQIGSVHMTQSDCVYETENAKCLSDESPSTNFLYDRLYK